MFEAEEAVPLAGATSAGVIVHNLRQQQKTKQLISAFINMFIFDILNYLSYTINTFGAFCYFILVFFRYNSCVIVEVRYKREVWLHFQHLKHQQAYLVTEW